MIACMLFFIVLMGVFISFSVFLAFTSKKLENVSPSSSVSVLRNSNLPWIPKTIAQAQSMNPTEFELLSVAVIVALGQGYTFYRHIGQSGDQGVDAKLLNTNNMLVAVQCKRYGDQNHIAPEQVLSFWGAIHRHRTIHGYFVTTSQFSKSSKDIVDASNGLIRCIDRDRLAWLLHYRSNEIAVAYRDILEQI